MFAYTIMPAHEQNAISRVFFAFLIYSPRQASSHKNTRDTQKLTLSLRQTHQRPLFAAKTSATTVLALLLISVHWFAKNRLGNALSKKTHFIWLPEDINMAFLKCELLHVDEAGCVVWNITNITCTISSYRTRSIQPCGYLNNNQLFK